MKSIKVLNDESTVSRPGILKIEVDAMDAGTGISSIDFSGRMVSADADLYLENWSFSFDDWLDGARIFEVGVPASAKLGT